MHNIIGLNNQEQNSNSGHLKFQLDFGLTGYAYPFVNYHSFNCMYEETPSLISHGHGSRLRQDSASSTSKAGEVELDRAYR